MAKVKSFFQCQGCGYISPKWLGKCPDCGAWNSFSEEVAEKTSPVSLSRSQPVKLQNISVSEGFRYSTGIGELDRVLGNGVVPGSVTLIGGDPGIGKSTLLLQALEGLTEKAGSALYISGEESPEQIKLRAKRLSMKSGDIILLPETALENILISIKEIKPGVVIIDSIQTVFTSELSSAPGSVSQVRECATRLMLFAKAQGIPLFLIGHVTKEGAIAGPRVLEHVVDTVLYFEGDRNHAFRILRAVKNRFGSTNEIGVFEMGDTGLTEVKNPSELFLSERPQNVSGSVALATIEGTRPLMVEIQGLVCRSSYGVPRRTSIGVDFNRVNLLLAVLERRAGLFLSGMDVFVNVVGGLRLEEPAVDLAVAAALASSVKDKPINSQTFVFGEIGLSGEIRAVSQAEQRLKEASRLGFRKAVVPVKNSAGISDLNKMEITPISTVAEAIEVIFF